MSTPWSIQFAPAFFAAGAVFCSLAVLGLYFALLRDRSRGRRRCSSCSYDMTGAPSLMCPECGRTARTERELYSTRRRWRLATFFALLGLLGVISLRAPEVLRAGFFAAVPIPILNFVLSWFPNDAAAAFESISQQPSTVPARTTWERLLAASYAGHQMSDSATSPAARKAAWVLQALGNDGRPAVPSLIEVGMRDHNSLYSLSSLAKEGVSEAQSGLWWLVLNAESPTSRLLALDYVLGTAFDQKECKRMLLQVMSLASDGSVRERSAFELARLGVLSQVELLVLVQGKDESTRRGIITGLALQGKRNQWLMPELLRGVDEEQELLTQVTCIRCVSEFGPLDEGWIRPLVRLLNSTDGEMRRYATIAAARLEATPLPKVVTDILFSALHGDQKSDSTYAARTVIIRAESFDQASLRLAFERLDPIDLVMLEYSRLWEPPAIDAALASDLAPLRKAAINRLIGGGAPSAFHVEALVRALETEDEPSIRADVLKLLAQRPASDDAITATLVNAGLHDPDSSVRAVAFRAAESRSGADTQLVAALVSALSDSSPEVALAAANSLARLGPRAEEARSALKVAADSHADDRVRAAAVEALSKLAGTR